MRLSDAIILGSALNPQGFGRFKSPEGSTCALGAAFDAMGKIPTVDCAVDIWPTASKTNALPYLPGCKEVALAEFLQNDGSVKILGAIVLLNDHFRWTRERIARWIVESGLDCESVEQPVAKTVEVEQAVTA